MGQRHQVFLRVPNPVKVFKNHKQTAEEKKKYLKMFGSGKYTILAFHHQWLYGLSAVSNAAQVLNFIKNSRGNEYRDVFSESIMGMEFSNADHFVQFVKMLMGIITDSEHPRGCGFERFTFLNEDEPDMRELYTHGDNNDGITIIDTETLKYCFMNIGGDSTIEMVERYKPISGEDYGKLYYPHTKVAYDEKFKKQEYTEEDIESYVLNGKTLEEKIQGNIDSCKPVFEKIKDFQILSKGEVDKMFPKTAKYITENTVVAS
jgi:hypothetical protein